VTLTLVNSTTSTIEQFLIQRYNQTADNGSLSGATNNALFTNAATGTNSDGDFIYFSKGGAGLAAGASTTFTFQLDIPAGGTFSSGVIGHSTTPEPIGIALGAMMLGGCGAIAYRRRRKAAQTEQVEDAAV
ncbi:MAG: hypothetical protein AAFP90_16370, partial [Planctomycetota bacterium]